MQIKLFKKFSPLLLLCFVLPVIAHADAPVRQKGMATVTFTGIKPTARNYRNAEHLAALNAIKRYVANSTNAETRNFESIRGKVSQNLDNYILGTTIISREIDKDASTLTVVVRADIDTSALADAFNANSAVGHTQAAKKSYVTFIFVARQQASVTRFGADKSSTSASQITKNGTNDQSVSQSGAQFSGEHGKIKKTRSFSSTTQQAANVKYRVTSSTAVNTAMTGVFTDAGYKVVSADFLKSYTHNMVNPAAFEHDYSAGNAISPTTLMNAVKGAEKVNVHYLAVGTMDEGLSNKDPETGLDRVYVTVTGTLYGLNGPFPQTLVSVGPEQFAGEGPTETVAVTNALELASKATAKKMAQAMAAQNVH